MGQDRQDNDTGTTTMTAYSDILKLLPKCTVEELQQIPEAIKPLLMMKGGSLNVSDAAIADTDDRAGDDILYALLKAHPMPGYHATSQLRKVRGYGEFVNRLPMLMEYFEQVETHDRIFMFMLFGWKALIDNLEAMGMSPGYALIMSHAHRIPAVIDRHFPGYAKAGMLGLAFRHIVGD